MDRKRLQNLRSQAFKRQNCRCFYCEFPMWESDQSEFCTRFGIAPKKAKFLKCTAEHLKDRQNGGADELENIAAACLWCNSRRHLKRQHRPPDPLSYKKRVKQLVDERRWHPAVCMLQHLADASVCS